MIEEDPFREHRSKLLAESLETSNEPRWGYFGIPGSLAIGDNSYAPRKMRVPKNEDDTGEPIANIKTRPVRKGAGPDVYFNFEPPLSNGADYSDPFIDPGLMGRKGKVWMIDPEAKFKPSGPSYVDLSKGITYVEHCDSFRDPVAMRAKYAEAGKPNMVTNPMKKGGGGVYTKGVLFGMDEERLFWESQADDYDAAKKQRARELEAHKKLLQESAFKGNDYGNRNFASNEESYMYDVPTHIPREPKPNNAKVANHEAAFKPCNPTKRGVLEGCMGKWGEAESHFPEWVPEPVAGGAVRKAKVEDAPPAFKVGAPRGIRKPTPSVTTNLRNMRNERPSSFSRPCL
jgi:hypothetical protein